MALAACSAFVASPIVAQEISSSKSNDFRFGIKVSPNFSWVKNLSEDVKPNGLGLGFSYGIMGDFGFSDNYAIGTELLVTSMSSKLSHRDTLIRFAEGLSQPYSGVQFDYRLQYVQLPVTLKMKTNEIGKFIWWAQFGFAPSILLANTLTVTSSPEYANGKFSPNATDNDFNGDDGFGVFRDNISFIRIPMVLGLGAEYRINGNTMLHFGLRFDNGINDFLRDKKAKARNNYLGLQIGVFF